jgi:hypothetical protein
MPIYSGISFAVLLLDLQQDTRSKGSKSNLKSREVVKQYFSTLRQ